MSRFPKASELEAGRELDALIATEVMGLWVVDRDWPYYWDTDEATWKAAQDPNVGATARGPIYVPEGAQWPPHYQEWQGCELWEHGAKPVPFYSDDFDDAWQVVEWLRQKGWEGQLRIFPPDYPQGHAPDCFGYRLEDATGEIVYEGWANSPVLAICRAAMHKAMAS